MSGILLRWLNEDLSLKQRVLNVEHDFSNGYLLGEILYMHNHQQNFHCFRQSSTSESKVDNFILLEPSLRLLGVNFDAQVACNVMHEKPGAASKLLYQVKMVLDRLSKFSTPVSMRPTIRTAGVKPLPNLPQRITKPQFDRATHAIFESTVRDMVQGQKEISLKRSLRRFEEEGVRQKELVAVEKERSLLAEELHTEAIRMQGLHDLAQRKALCSSWEENNLDDWMDNMKRKRDREVRNRLFLRKVEKSRLSRLQRARMIGRRAVANDLPQFEARSRDALRTASNQEEQESTPWAVTASNRGYLEARALDKGYQWQMTKFKEKKSGERTSAREKRRRRYTTEREESLCDEYLQEGRDVLKQKLMKRCRAEENVETQLKSVFRYKAIMTENRKYRSRQYTARAAVDAEGLLKRDQASLDSLRRQYELGVRVQMGRCQAARAMRAGARAARVERICRETLDSIVALSMEVVLFRNYSEHTREPDATAAEQDPMPRRLWMDMKWTFSRGGPPLRMAGSHEPAAREWGCTPLLSLATKSDTPFDPSEEPVDMEDKVAQFLDDCELRDYISETGLWHPADDSVSCIGGDGPIDHALQSSGDSVGEDDLVTEHASFGTSNRRYPQIPESNGRKKSDPNTVPETMGREEEERSPTADGTTICDKVLGTVDPQHALGECVIEVSLAADPLPPLPPPPAVPAFSLRICMGGSTSTGKSEQAIRLAERYCLKVLSAEELTQKAMDIAANAMAAGRAVLTSEESLGQQASSALLQGGSVSDRVYAELLVLAIKETEQQNQAAVAEEEGSESSVIDDGGMTYMGWIIDDFPCTVEQASVLEKCLSGYDETAHVPSRQDAASRLAPATPVLPETVEHKEILPSGIDLVIFIEAPRTAILKRSLGRIFDPVTGETYHFEGALPQYDMVCKERLVQPEDPANASAQLALQVAAQEEASEALKNFLGKFGTLRMVDGGDCTPDALFGKLNSVVVAMIQETPARDETFRDDSTGHSSDSNVGRPNTSPMDDTLVAPGAEAAIATTTEHVNDAASSMGIVDESVGSPLGHTAGRQPEEAAEVLSLSHDGAVATAQEGVVAAENESSGGLVPVERLMVAIARHWRLAEVQFEDAVRKVFRELRNQRLLIADHVRGLRDRFSEFLERPDNKQTILVDFCSSVNAVDQDLRFDDRACKELLLREEECRSKLWYDVEERKSSAGRVLRDIKDDGWVERQKGMAFNHVMVLMQAEVERFHAGVSMLHDYYNAKVQEVLQDDSVALAILVPQETEGDGAASASKTKVVPGNKAAGGAKSKDRGRASIEKGSDKKGKGGKGAKGGGGDGEPSLATSGQRTALPPCLILPSVVDVIASGHSAHTGDEVDESASGAVGGKGKVDKSKKAKKKPGAKSEGQETDEVHPPLTAALNMVLVYAEAWGPHGFPAPSDDQELSEVDGDSADSTGRGRQLPCAALLHRAVWAQASVLSTRVRLLHGVGQDVAASIQTKADLVHAELQSGVDARVTEEGCAVEAAMALARKCIDNQTPIEHEWILQGGLFRVDTGVRLVPVPDTPSSPTQHETLASPGFQEDRLRDALRGVRHSENGDSQSSAVVMPHQATNVLLRLSEDEGALPDDWACLSEAELSRISNVLDPGSSGEVNVEVIVDMVKNSSAVDVLSSVAPRHSS